jgi:hypothetical protein
LTHHKTVFNVNGVPRTLFTPETARILAKKSHGPDSARNRNSPAKQLRALRLAQDTAGSGIQRHSLEVKRRLSEELLAQTCALEERAVKFKELPNGPDGEGRASLVARITDTAAKVYGWDSEKGNSVVLIGLVSSMDPEQPVLDVEVV